jgi:hypothetical protein
MIRRESLIFEKILQVGSYIKYVCASVDIASVVLLPCKDSILDKTFLNSGGA